MTFASPSLSLDGATAGASVPASFRIAGGPAVSRVSPALEASPAPVRAARHLEKRRVA